MEVCFQLMWSLRPVQQKFGKLNMALHNTSIPGMFVLGFALTPHRFQLP